MENNQLLYDFLKTGNKDAYNKLTTNNLNLVRYVIGKIFYGSSKNFEDLYSDYLGAGCIGLDNAIKNFDIDKIGKVNFSTYAVVCIKNAILVELKKEKKATANTISIDSLVNEEESDNLRLIDVIASPDNNIEDYIDEDFQTYKSKKILSVIDTFEPRDREVVKLYYGFYGEKYSQTQIADKVNISKSMVSLILIRCNKKLYSELMEFNPHKSNLDLDKTTNEEEKIEAQYMHLFSKYGRGKIVNALNKIPKSKRDIVHMYLGLNGARKNCEQIASILKIPTPSVDSIIRRSYKQVQRIVSDNITSSERRIISFNDLYDNQTIEEFINEIPESKREIFIRYYGINNTLVLGVPELAIKYNMSEHTIKNIIGIYTKKLKFYYFNKISSVEELIEFESKITPKELKELREDKIGKTYNNNKIEKSLDLLTTQEKLIIMHYLGLYNSEVYKLEEFMRFLKIDGEELNNQIINILEKLNVNILIKK